MPSPRIDQIQAALAGALQHIPGAVVYPFIPQTYNYSQIIIEIGNYSTSRDTFSPQYTYLFDLNVYCLSQPPDYGQVALAQLMSPNGPESIEQALLTNPTLGGVVDDTAVEPYIFTVAHAAMTWVELNNIPFVRLIRPVEIYA